MKAGSLNGLPRGCGSALARYKTPGRALMSSVRRGYGSALRTARSRMSRFGAARIWVFQLWERREAGCSSLRQYKSGCSRFGNGANLDDPVLGAKNSPNNVPKAGTARMRPSPNGERVARRSRMGNGVGSRSQTGNRWRAAPRCGTGDALHPVNLRYVGVSDPVACLVWFRW